jgi:ApbE superfamily uncharacterized protein (UPF0280 family)
MTGAQATWLPGGRLHLHHGPIDLILQGWGTDAALRDGYARAMRRFDTILAELADELPALRSEDATVTGPVAQAMAAAVAPFRPVFITPMAAVAGAVAQTILAVFVQPGIGRAYANNGGDIALHLDPGQEMTCAIAGTAGQITIRHQDAVRGIATSGWRGRSWSLGIADSVTILAKTAAQADAAATMVANAVDLPGHPAITRSPATALQADSDLGMRLVTTGVGPLTPPDIARALDQGAAAARAVRAQGLIEAAALFLHPDSRTLGPILMKEAHIA